MISSAANEDEADIRRLIANHFIGMSWDKESAPDWELFAEDFHPAAVLFPAARPVAQKSLHEFIERMNGVAETVLESFEEWTLGMQILQFGNVAVVLAASEMLENGEETNHDVSAYLLVKDEGRWRIAAHAWDKVTGDKPLPDALR